MIRRTPTFDRLKSQGQAGFVAYVMAGDPDAGTTLHVMHGLAEAGADAFLIACTELSVIDRPRVGGLPLLDTLDALVDAILEAAGKMPGRR